MKRELKHLIAIVVMGIASMVLMYFNHVVAACILGGVSLLYSFDLVLFLLHGGDTDNHRQV